MGRGKDVEAFLVGASGGNSFHVTAAGRDALKAARLKSVPRRYHVDPAAPLALELVQLADVGVGRVPKSLRKAVAKVRAAQTVERIGREKLEAIAPVSHTARELLEAARRPGGMREQLRRQLEPGGARYLLVRGTVSADGLHVANELIAGEKLDRAGDVVPSCSVCGEDVGPGGRKTSPALCARCYQRERRGLAPSSVKAKGEGRTESITVQVKPAMKKRLEAAAAAQAVSVSRLVEGWCVFNLGPGPDDQVRPGHLRRAVAKMIENNRPRRG